MESLSPVETIAPQLTAPIVVYVQRYFVGRAYPFGK